MAGKGPVKGLIAGRIAARTGNEMSSTAELGRKTRVIVVAGLVDKPVVGVPTSVGYGASFGGIAALLGMLNACATR